MRDARYAAFMALAAFTVIGALTVPMQKPATPTPPMEPAVPLQEWTTADAGAMAFRMVPGKIPAPGPNQLRACDPERSEVLINGGCWVKTDKKPPCPRGKQWEHEGACYLPVAEAKPVPQSGEPKPRGVAEP
jgi:hypothetical protein